MASRCSWTRASGPGRSTRDMYLDAAGNPIEGLSTRSAKAAGIPGEPAGWDHIAKTYGRLPLVASLEPAIQLARKGHEISPKRYAEIAEALESEGLSAG